MQSDRRLHARIDAEDRELCMAHMRANIADALAPGPTDAAARQRRLREVIDRLGLAATRRARTQKRLPTREDRRALRLFPRGAPDRR